MRWEIWGFAQGQLMAFNIMPEEIPLLKWFADFSASGRMRSKLYNNEKYFEIDYQALLAEFPYLRIKTPDKIYRSLTNLVKKGILDAVKIGKNHYKLTEKYFELLYSPENKKANQKSDIEEKQSVAEILNDVFD